MALKRPTLQKATEWNMHENEIMVIEPPMSDGEQAANQATYFDMAASVVRGAMYTYKKFRRTYEVQNKDIAVKSALTPLMNT